jgi:hypothetical protein
MKKLFTVVSACALTLAIGGTVFAQGRTGGCNECLQGNQVPQAVGQSDQMRKFQMDTLDLRQEMMLKRFEMQRENLKGTPDSVKIAALKTEVSAIQARIISIRAQSGLPDNGKRDGECFKMDGSCSKKDGMGGCNKHSGMKGGCNGQPCEQK